MTVAACDRRGRRERRRRGGVLVALGLLLLGLLPAVSVAQAEGPRGTDRVCEAPFRSGFADIDGSAHEDNIRCMADHGIAQGRGDGTYAPRAEVRRDQMASFIARFLETATGEELPDGDPDRFDDVPADNVHADAINALAEVGVVEGRGDGSYAPRDVVRRDAMASFIRRAVSYLDDGEPTNGSQPTAGAGGHFDDVPSDNVHADNIDALGEHGVVAGFGDGTYRPRDEVKRDQMASFVMRGYDYADEHVLGGSTGDGDGDGEEPEEPGTVSGTVSEAGSGDPIDGATISVDDSDLSTTTTGDGGYTLAEVPPGTYGVTADAPGYVAQTETDVEVGEGEDVTGIDFALEAAGSVAGTVTDAGDGSAIEGATVTVEDVDGATALTGGDGTYVIDDVAPGTYTVTADAEDHHPASQEEVDVVAGEQTTVDLALEEMVPGSISGTVTDGDDDLAGATVTVEGTDLQATSDADGAYTIGDVPPGEHTVTAEAEDFHPSSREDVEVVDGEETTLHFVLDAIQPGHISGRVVGADDGEPVEEAEVWVDGQSEFTATTDAEGAYTIEDVPPGTYTVAANALDFERASQTGVEVVENETTQLADFALELSPPRVEFDADRASLDGRLVHREQLLEEAYLAVANPPTDRGELELSWWITAPDGTSGNGANPDVCKELFDTSTCNTINGALDETFQDSKVFLDGDELEVAEEAAFGDWSVRWDVNEQGGDRLFSTAYGLTAQGEIAFRAEETDFGEIDELFLAQSLDTVELGVSDLANPDGQRLELRLHLAPDQEEFVWFDPGVDPEDEQVCERLFHDGGQAESCQTLREALNAANAEGGPLDGGSGEIEVLDEETLVVAHDAVTGDWALRWELVAVDEGRFEPFSVDYEFKILSGNDITFDHDSADDNREDVDAYVPALDGGIIATLEIANLINPAGDELAMEMHVRDPSGNWAFGDDGCTELFDSSSCTSILTEDELLEETFGHKDESAVSLLGNEELTFTENEIEAGQWQIRWRVVGVRDGAQRFAATFDIQIDPELQDPEELPAP